MLDVYIQTTRIFKTYALRITPSTLEASLKKYEGSKSICDQLLHGDINESQIEQFKSLIELAQEKLTHKLKKLAKKISQFKDLSSITLTWAAGNIPVVLIEGAADG